MSSVSVFFQKLIEKLLFKAYWEASLCTWNRLAGHAKNEYIRRKCLKSIVVYGVPKIALPEMRKRNRQKMLQKVSWKGKWRLKSFKGNMDNNKWKSAKTICLTVAIVAQPKTITRKMAFMEKSKQNSNSLCDRRAADPLGRVTVCVCFCVLHLWSVVRTLLT